MHLDERPTLGLPPANIVGMIEVVPDVDHLEKVIRLTAFKYEVKTLDLLSIQLILVIQ